MTVITTTQPRRASTAERARVHRWVRKWQHEFYQHVLTINVIFHDYPMEGTLAEGASAGCAASMDSTQLIAYHTATLSVYPRFFDDSSDEQEFVIVHEMAHLLTAPLALLINRLQNGTLVTRQEADDVEEAATDRFARIVFYGGSAKHVELPIKVKREPAASRKTRKR